MSLAQTNNWREVLSEYIIQRNGKILCDNLFVVVGNVCSNSPSSDGVQLDFRFSSIHLPDESDPCENKLVFCFFAPVFPSVVGRYYSGTNDHWSEYMHVAIHEDFIVSCEKETSESLGLDHLHINLNDGTRYSVVLEKISSKEQ